MGLEARCRVRFEGQESDGDARLESADLWFRGRFRLRIPFDQVRSAEARGGRLEVRFAESLAVFELGRDAERWALKIRYPRGLLDKLGVKPGARVSVLGLDDPDFLGKLAERSADVSRRPRKATDLVFWAPRSRHELAAKLRALRGSLKPDGGVWVVWPKGKKELREDDVRAAGQAAGLVDVKVVSFSDLLSGLKMVIPVARRPRN
jgi:hypothetical protein